MKKLKAVLALSSLFFAGTTWADVPAQIKQQVPGYYRVAVGEYEVTALFDHFRVEREGGETFGDFCRRVGVDALRARAEVHLAGAQASSPALHGQAGTPALQSSSNGDKETQHVGYSIPA